MFQNIKPTLRNTKHQSFLLQNCVFHDSLIELTFIDEFKTRKQNTVDLKGSAEIVEAVGSSVQQYQSCIDACDACVVACEQY